MLTFFSIYFCLGVLVCIIYFDDFCEMAREGTYNIEEYFPIGIGIVILIVLVIWPLWVGAIFLDWLRNTDKNEEESD